jgi:hypothetical protein
MTDLTKLYDDWVAKRLAWKTVHLEKEELLLKGIVDEIEALKVQYDAVLQVAADVRVGIPQLAAEADAIRAKRGPGRPPKVETV